MASAQPERIKAQLLKQIAEFCHSMPALDEERISQEVAILLLKADIREELERILVHIGAARELLASQGSIGRQFDFLCQEFNREANTLCAKSPDVMMTQVGLSLKTTIDQMREQVQNVE